jgi:hypothetical protein
MASTNPTALETALRRLFHDRVRSTPTRKPGARRRSAARKAQTRPSSSVVARELDMFRRGQSLAYWNHDRPAD